MRTQILCGLAVLPLASLAVAGERAWSFDFHQGIAEYAVGEFGTGGSNLALSCAEAGLNPGSVSVSLARAGYTPHRATRATFTTDKGNVAITFSREGWADWPSLAAAPEFRTLWRLLATARTLRVGYGPGKPMVFPVANARRLFAGPVCPRQLAD